jgi:hypothetical protein
MKNIKEIGDYYQREKEKAWNPTKRRRQRSGSPTAWNEDF